MLKTILIASLLALPTIPSHAQQVAYEPYCYIRLDNTIINLNNLCGVNKTQIRQPVNIRLAQSSGDSSVGLKASNIRLKKTIYKKQVSYSLTGSITNTSNIPKRMAKINYTAYKQSGKSLKKDLSIFCGVDADILLPGDTSDCEGILIGKPDFIIVESIEETFRSKQILNACYTDTSKGGQLCKLLSPSSIERY